MKKIICILVLVLCLTSVRAQKDSPSSMKDTSYVPTKWDIELYGYKLSGQDALPIADVYILHKLSKHWSIHAFLLMNPTWWEVYAGIKYHPTKWLSMGVFGGLEIISPRWRTAGNLNIETDYFILNSGFEYGPSGYWFNLQTAAVFAKKVVSLGFMARRFHGAGPRVDIFFPRTPVHLWVAGLCLQGSVFGGTNSPAYGGAAGFYLKFD